MLDTTKERSVELPDKTRGFIVGDYVLAPFYCNGTLLAKKDGHDIVLTFHDLNRFGVARFNLPFAIPVEPLHFRHTVIHKDTFLFRVFDKVTLCRPFSIQHHKGRYQVATPTVFCPVYDRHGHLIGINSGMFCDELLCIPIHELL